MVISVYEKLLPNTNIPKSDYTLQKHFCVHIQDLKILSASILGESEMRTKV